jgi:hypothetical protein
MKKTKLSSGGTSYHGVNITTTVQELIDILGEPTHVENTGEDKVNFEWNCITSNEDIVTIYDWKEYRPISKDEVIEFHIGGHTLSHTLDAQKELSKIILQNNLV